MEPNLPPKISNCRAPQEKFISVLQSEIKEQGYWFFTGSKNDYTE